MECGKNPAGLSSTVHSNANALRTGNLFRKDAAFSSALKVRENF